MLRAFDTHQNAEQHFAAIIDANLLEVQQRVVALQADLPHDPLQRLQAQLAIHQGLATIEARESELEALRRDRELPPGYRVVRRGNVFSVSFEGREFTMARTKRAGYREAWAHLEDPSEYEPAPEATTEQVWQLARSIHVSLFHIIRGEVEGARALPHEASQDWDDATPKTIAGRCATAAHILAEYEPRTRIAGSDWVVEGFVEFLHQAEKTAIDAGLVALDLGRPWVPFDQLRDNEKAGRREQVRELCERYDFVPRAEQSL